MRRMFVSTFKYLCSNAMQVCTVCAAAMVWGGCSHSVKPEEAPAVRVEVRVVGARSAAGGAQGALGFSGTVEARTTSALSFNVPGTITAMYVAEGDRVSRGQILARIRSDNYDNSAAIAQAQLAEAEDAYARMKKLHDADALPDMQWVAAQNNLKQARSAAAIASQAVADAVIRAPFNGVVAHKIAQVGQSVITSQPVLEVVTAGELNVGVAVPENEIGNIVPGARAVLSFPAIGIDSIVASVDSKSVVSDPLTRAYKVKINLPADKRILPGMVCDVSIESSGDDAAAPAGKTAAVLPSQAVLLDSDNRNFVWTVSNGQAERRFVTADVLVPGGVAVLSGLQAGDTVIVAGMQKVGTGSHVIPITDNRH